MSPSGIASVAFAHALALAATACSSPYVRGTLPGQRFAGPCVDVGIQAAGVLPRSEGPVVVVGLGNACDHSVAIDLRRLRVVGLDGVGGQEPMEPYDPDHEMRVRRIAAGDHGEEWIEMHVPAPAWAAKRSIVALDVDVGQLEDPRGASHWVRIP